MPRHQNRHAGTDRCTDLDGDHAGGDDPGTNSQPIDPASVVARSMLERALSGLTGVSDSVCHVTSPSSAWTDLLLAAWTNTVQNGSRGTDADCHRNWRESNTPWVFFSRTAPLQGTRDAGSEALERAMWEGCPVVGIAADPELLPKDLVEIAEYGIDVGLPHRDDILSFAERLPGEVKAWEMTASEVTGLTPRLLRLAASPGQTSDEWVSKLRKLLAYEAVTVAPAISRHSPRAAPDLTRLHGMPEATRWGTALALDIAAYRAGSLPWSAVDGGCLLSGPPGVGKTLFARALAETCGVPLVMGSYSSWHSSGQAHQGEFLKAMRRSFDEARQQAPCIMFLDEIDSFPDRGRVTHAWADYMVQVVNALLAEMDGVQDRDGVVLIGACNHPEKLDPALVRSGRLDRHIRLHLPCVHSLAGILREHLGSDLHGHDLARAATFAAGSSSADCERFVRDARRRARGAGRTVEMEDLHAAMAGNDAVPTCDLRRVAVHEAGHAVAATVLGRRGIDAVSLMASGGRGGAMFMERSRSGLMSAATVREDLIILLSGRAAEEVVFGGVSSGSGGGADSDLAKATSLAVRATASLGLDSPRPPLWLGEFGADGLADTLAANPALAERVRSRLGDAYVEALALLRGAGGALTALADALIERGALDGAGVASILNGHVSVQVSP